MIIPIRCFSCNKVLGNKYNFFIQEVNRRKIKKGEKNQNNEITSMDLNSNQPKKCIEGEVLDYLGLVRMCCRTKMLSHIPLIDET